jgi:hypothetical protein
MSKIRLNANSEHFFKAFEDCLKKGFTDVQARMMADGYESRGFIDASNGCMHYVLRYKMAKLNQGVC